MAEYTEAHFPQRYEDDPNDHVVVQIPNPDGSGRWMDLGRITPATAAAALNSRKFSYHGFSGFRTHTTFRVRGDFGAFDGADALVECGVVTYSAPRH